MVFILSFSQSVPQINFAIFLSFQSFRNLSLHSLVKIGSFLHIKSKFYK
jgi:hypothetical protein